MYVCLYMHVVGFQNALNRTAKEAVASHNGADSYYLLRKFTQPYQASETAHRETNLSPRIEALPHSQGLQSAQKTNTTKLISHPVPA